MVQIHDNVGLPAAELLEFLLDGEKTKYDGKKGRNMWKAHSKLHDLLRLRGVFPDLPVELNQHVRPRS